MLYMGQGSRKAYEAVDDFNISVRNKIGFRHVEQDKKRGVSHLMRHPPSSYKPYNRLPVVLINDKT